MMKGKYYLVLLVALVAVFVGINQLARTYNQMTNNHIPQSVQLTDSGSAYRVAIFGTPYELDKEEIKSLWLELKGQVPVETARFQEFSQDILLVGEDFLNQAVDKIREFAGQKLKDDGKLKEKGDLV